MLLVDHQSGLTNLVQDFSPDDSKNNVLALGDAAKHFNLPTILTTSFEDGPNGPLVPELKEMFPGIVRPGGRLQRLRRHRRFRHLQSNDP